MNRILTHVYTKLAFMARELEESQFYGLSRIARHAAQAVYRLIGGAR